MYAKKLIVKTDSVGNLKAMPKLPANKQFEAIFLSLENEGSQHQKRRPHPDIAGRVEIIGDIIDSVAQSDWDLAE